MDVNFLKTKIVPVHEQTIQLKLFIQTANISGIWSSWSVETKFGTSQL